METIYETLIDAVKDYELKVRLIQQLDHHYDFKTKEGLITLYGVKEDEIAVYHINVNQELRQQGIFKDLINYLISQVKYRRVMVLAVGSRLLDQILTRYGFVCYGGDFIWTRP